MSNKYVEYAKIGFKQSIEYKSYLLSLLVTPALLGVFYYIIWKFIFAAQSNGEPGFTIGGFTFEEMLVYLCIGLLLNVVRNTELSHEIANSIKTGDIAIFLCRPVNFAKSILAQSIGGRVLQMFAFVILLIVMTVSFDLYYPKGALLAIFLVYTLLFIVFDTLIYASIGALAFWFTEIWGIQNAISQTLWILSGRVLPLTLFPAWFQGFIVFTPFYYLEFTLASMYLGKMGVQESLVALGVFSIWTVLLVVLMRLLYKRGFTKLEALGG